MSWESSSTLLEKKLHGTNSRDTKVEVAKKLVVASHDMLAAGVVADQTLTATAMVMVMVMVMDTATIPVPSDCRDLTTDLIPLPSLRLPRC
jgi:hypothetical protein